MASQIEVNPCSVSVRVENRLKKNLQFKRLKRGEIKRFSKNSQRRLARLLLNNHGRFKYFFTVTYRNNHKDCMISKQHIDYFLTRFRKVGGKSYGYVWVLEFQKRGAVHFHIWFDEIPINRFREWESLPVRKQIIKRFGNDADGLERYKFLTYLWLEITKQLSDEKAVKAATDLKIIYSSGFTVSYAIKYAWKAEQKEYLGNIDEETGEVLSEWVGRYWGASRSVKNERLYDSMDVKIVRIFRKWMARSLGKKKFSGMWFLIDEKMRGRVANVCIKLELTRQC
jgi:hypothetical protein